MGAYFVNRARTSRRAYPENSSQLAEHSSGSISASISPNLLPIAHPTFSFSERQMHHVLRTTVDESVISTFHMMKSNMLRAITPSRGSFLVLRRATQLNTQLTGIPAEPKVPMLILEAWFSVGTLRLLSDGPICPACNICPDPLTNSASGYQHCCNKLTNLVLSEKDDL